VVTPWPKARHRYCSCSGANSTAALSTACVDLRIRCGLRGVFDSGNAPRWVPHMSVELAALGRGVAADQVLAAAAQTEWNAQLTTLECVVGRRWPWDRHSRVRILLSPRFVFAAAWSAGDRSYTTSPLFLPHACAPSGRLAAWHPVLLGMRPGQTFLPAFERALLAPARHPLPT